MNNEKLAIEHLAPYLPYGLECIINFPNKSEKGVLKSVGLHPGTGGEDLLTVFIQIEKDNSRQIILKKDTKTPIFKPLLIPLSEAPIKLVEYYGFAGVDDFSEYVHDRYVASLCMDELYDGHYDVFGLIEKGLAIDKTTI